MDTLADVAQPDTPARDGAAGALSLWEELRKTLPLDATTRVFEAVLDEVRKEE